MEFDTLPPRLQSRSNRRKHHCGRNLPPRAMKFHQPAATPTLSTCAVKKPVEIRQVWASNLRLEFSKIHWAMSLGYNFIALDTEFPGSPYVPDGIPVDYRSRSCEQHYAVLKMNVDRLKIIQAGVTLTDQFGNLPDFGSENRFVWEFNFSDFDIDRDECNKESIDLLERQGINFQNHKRFGINSAFFAALMVNSGMIGRQSLVWITFQGGVDLAYFIKILTKCDLPSQLERFKSCVRYYFGERVFDVKHMMMHCDKLYGGLNKVAETLNVERDAGKSHQSGSDSLLTAMVFQKIVGLYFAGEGEALRFAGKLHNFV
ncbi:hypothetical protein QQ045_028585 [Rhodiola kirilowii]